MTPSWQPSRSLGERFQRLRNWQSDDFWAMVFARPLALLFLTPIADLRFVTPNRITHVANVFWVLGAAAILRDDETSRWLAIVFLNAHLVADNMDGTLARYRLTGSSFGSFYDKTTDSLGFLLMFSAMGWVAYQHTGQGATILCALVGAHNLLFTGYAKWVDAAESTRLDTMKALEKERPETMLARMLRRNPSPPPPERTAIDWLKWLGRALVSIVQLNEVDIFFFASLALATNKLDWFCYYAAITQTLAATYSFVRRSWRMTVVDKEKQALAERVAARGSATTQDAAR